MAFKLPDLPYAKTGLEPAISAETLTYHHDKHHNAYITKTNDAIKGADLDGEPLEDVVRAARNKGDQGLINNASQAWNHTFYWHSMTGDSAAPSEALKSALDSAFGGLDGFKDKFKSTGAGHFASGWVWLVAKGDGTLDIKDTHDEGSILPEDDGLIPLLLCDVWEHAYYLDRQNDRGAYLDAVANKLLNWDFASKQFDAARSGGVGWKHPGPDA